MLAKGMLHWFRAAERSHRRLIAPEALSRFYQQSGNTRVVGASWMTREDRDHEIIDQHGYLDQVYDAHLADVPHWQVHAFSQGVPTAFRWLLSRPRRPGVLVCWGSHAPIDIDLGQLKEALAGWQVHYVVGDRDRYVEPASISADAARLRAAGIAVELHRFNGGHRIDDGVLAELEVGPVLLEDPGETR
jgi:predicted esterase